MHQLNQYRWLLVAVGLTVGLLAAVMFIWPESDLSAEQLLNQSRLALERGDYERAERLAARVPADAPQFPQASLIAGESATKRGRLRQALDYYDRLPDGGSEVSLRGWSSAGDLLWQLGSPTEAERKYLRVLNQRPDDGRARASLAALLTGCGRRWESVPHVLHLIRSRQFSVNHLLWLGYTDSILDLPPGAGNSGGPAANDPNLLIALARVALADGEYSRAAELSRRAIALDSRQIESWAILGQALVRDSPAAFVNWHRSLPQSAEQHPHVWLARGDWAVSRDELEVAVRCFWEAVCRDPDQRTANYRLGQILTTLDRQEAAVFLARAERLDALESTLDLIYRGRSQLRSALPRIRRAAELTEALGRRPEAWAWSQVALAIRPDQPWALALAERTVAALPCASVRTSAEAAPCREVDLSSFPLPAWREPAESPRQPADRSGLMARVRFEEDTQQAGIGFEYFNGYTPATAGKQIYATAGGGVAVLDFDADGWPDLYFTQGCRWPPREADRAYRDRLFRNLGNGRFDEITEAARLGDGRYSQGVTVGDLDNDGFGDLYVANIGQNRLYRNNGDGTFDDVTLESGIVGDAWTASCLMADLNGDSLPEIYDVNYLAGPKAFELVCRKGGEFHACHPSLFDAEMDQLFLNLGTGRFREITDSAGIAHPDGKGLGIVAADFRGCGRLDLFIANDTVANFYFVNETPDSGAGAVFREHALAAGLAFSGEGAAQACMGVAVDDWDGNGLLDLMVTNFYAEPNALYVQEAGSLFRDATRDSGLHQPSLWMLGFGTQSLDADLDGEPDLVVANGHIADLSSEGEPYRMRPQFFRNLGQARFLELATDSLGAFFEGEYLGRGLARLDWNRDGLEDFVVSHLDRPAALLTNRTEPTGRFVALQLRGVHCSRDAIGATVEIEAGGRTRVRQLTAGDGYYATNQRQLVFGLGAAERVERMAVRWPSGREQVFENVPADREYLAVEGRSDLMPMR